MTEDQGNEEDFVRVPKAQLLRWVQELEKLQKEATS